MPKNQPLPTLKEIHAELTRVPVTKREKVMSLLGVTTPQTFYDVLNGSRHLSEAEKIAVAGVYDKTPDQINWQDDPKPIA